MIEGVALPRVQRQDGRKRKAFAIAFAAAPLLATAQVNAAGADACEGRPTDPVGYQGYAYGDAAAATYDTARVRVHYAMTGPHAPALATTRTDAIPDSVALTGEIAENALTKYAAMGFRSPPSDASCASNGGDDRLDIYLVAFAGADGTTAPDACVGRVCASFVLVESTFRGRSYPSVTDGFRTVVSHELFHAVQNAYDAELDRFWAEGTAQWAMKTVYPDLTDFERQLPAFFQDPSRSLDSQPSGVTAGFLYGSAVWPLFLTLRHGDGTVRAVLEKEADGTKAIAAADAVLRTKNASIADDLPLFGAWNAATKALAGTGGYPAAASYPGVEVAALADGVAGITSGLGYFVYRGILEGRSNVSLATDPAQNGGVLVPIEGGKPALERAVKLPVDAEGDVLVVVAGIATTKTDAPFALRMGEAASPMSADAGLNEPNGSSGSHGTGNEGGGMGTGCAVLAVAATPPASVVAALLAVLAACAARRRTRS